VPLGLFVFCAISTIRSILVVLVSAPRCPNFNWSFNPTRIKLSEILKMFSSVRIRNSYLPFVELLRASYDLPGFITLDRF